MKILAWLAFLVLLTSCNPVQKTNTGTQNALVTKSGNASIILHEDGTVEIKGTKIELNSSGPLVLKGKPLDMNP